MQINLKWKRIIGVTLAIYLFYLWRSAGELKLFDKIKLHLPNLDLSSGNDRVSLAVLCILLIFITGVVKLLITRRDR